MNLEEIEAKVRAQLDDRDVDGYFKSEELRKWANEGQRDIARKTLCLQEQRYLEPIEGLDLDRYYLPKDFIRMFKVFINGRPVGEVAAVDRDKRKGYILWGDTIEITPHAGGAEKIELWYYRKAHDMDIEDDLAVPDIPQPYQDLIVAFANYRALAADERLEDAQLVYQEYMQDIQIMRTEFASEPRRKTIRVERGR